MTEISTYIADLVFHPEFANLSTIVGWGEIRPTNYIESLKTLARLLVETLFDKKGLAGDKIPFDNGEIKFIDEISKQGVIIKVVKNTDRGVPFKYEVTISCDSTYSEDDIRLWLVTALREAEADGVMKIINIRYNRKTD